MSRSDLTETGRDRAALARDAGFSRVSFVSVLAGVLVAYGAFAVLVAVVAAIASAAGVQNTLTVNDWARIGVGSAIVIALVLLVSYGFGGYVAGRMARRAGLLNGLAVFVFAVAIIAVLAAIAATQTDSSTIVANLRSLGIPTSGTEWGKIGTVAGLGSLAAMLVGAAFGGGLGERWHTKLTRRAAAVDTAATEPDRDALDERAGATRADQERVRPGAAGTDPSPPDTAADDRFAVRRDAVNARVDAVRETRDPGAEEGRHVADRDADTADTAVRDDSGAESAARREQRTPRTQ
jgi:hypothetical protein